MVSEEQTASGFWRASWFSQLMVAAIFLFFFKMSVPVPHTPEIRVLFHTFEDRMKFFGESDWKGCLSVPFKEHPPPEDSFLDYYSFEGSFYKSDEEASKCMLIVIEEGATLVEYVISNRVWWERLYSEYYRDDAKEALSLLEFRGWLQLKHSQHTHAMHASSHQFRFNNNTI